MHTYETGMLKNEMRLDREIFGYLPSFCEGLGVAQVAKSNKGLVTLGTGMRVSCMGWRGREKKTLNLRLTMGGMDSGKRPERG